MRLIDADALIEKFNESVDMAECLVDKRTAERFATFCALADAVKKMPTVNADIVTREVPKKPRLRRFYEDDEEYIYFKCPNHCSIICEVYPQDNYCRNCGQKLDWSGRTANDERMD